jgi:hypothetical protein
MKIAGYEFDHICDIEPLRDQQKSLQQHMPQNRYKNVRGLPLNKYGSGPFCKFKIPSLYRVSGVYVLVIAEQVRYVGECASLSARFNMGYGNISPKNCFKGGQETNCRLNNLIYATAQANERISLWFFTTPNYKSLEIALRSALSPAWNRI